MQAHKYVLTQHKIMDTVLCLLYYNKTQSAKSSKKKRKDSDDAGTLSIPNHSYTKKEFQLLQHQYHPKCGTFFFLKSWQSLFSTLLFIFINFQLLKQFFYSPPQNYVGHFSGTGWLWKNTGNETSNRASCSPVVVVMPGGGLHVQDGFLDVAQDVQVLLKLVLDLQQAPGNLWTLLATEVRHLCLGPFFLPSKVKLGLAHLRVEREHGVKCLQAPPACDPFSSDVKHTTLGIAILSTCMHAQAPARTSTSTVLNLRPP